MTVGGSGFLVLLKGGKRLAYMMVRDHGVLEFYDVWNRAVWDDMRLGDEGYFAALRRGFWLGQVSVRKVIKSPDGVIRARSYNTVAAEVEVIDDGETVADLGLPLRIRLLGWGQVIPEKPPALGHPRIPLLVTGMM